MRLPGRADLFFRPWRTAAARLLILAMVAVIVGTGLAHAAGEGLPTAGPVPLAARAAPGDPAAWALPLSAISLYRLTDGRQRLGQLLGLIHPRTDGLPLAAEHTVVAAAAVVVLCLAAPRDHGVRAPPGMDV